MANKKYISIIRLFEYCDIDTNANFQLARAKKQLQAEFGITQNGFIEVEGYIYTKQDVFEEIERTDFTNRFQYHKKIWQHEAMLNLLEKNEFQFFNINETFAPYKGNPDFDIFFSPYFSTPFQYLSRTLLKDKKLMEMGNLLALEDFLQPDEREEAFRPLRIFLDENMRLLRNTNKNNYTMMNPQLRHWIDQDWYIFFNNLPHEFYEEKTDLITLLINLGVDIQKSYKKDCKRMSAQLISLEDIPQTLRELIVSNHSIYTGSGNSSGGKSRNYFWLGWLVFMIIRGATSNGCGDSKSKNEIREYIPPQIREQNDSAIYELQKKLNKKDSFF